MMGSSEKKMDFFEFRGIVKSAVRIRGQNLMAPKSTLDVDSLVNNIDDAIDKALQEGCETEEVMNWMRRVEDLEYIILSELRDEFENKGKKCCFGWFPNLKSQHQLSMEADKYVQDVAELLKKIRRTHEEALSKTEQKVAAATVKDFVYFDSRRDVWEEIMVALQSPRTCSIGVYGEAGVGKTMLVEEIKRKAKQKKLFDDVVMAKVTNNPDMRRIQDDIAHDLGLELPDRVTAADQIRSRLENRKVLVILDDIWARIDLKEVGIPFGNKHKQKFKQLTEKKNEEISSVEEQKECILLMTSKDRDVLSHDMDAQKIIEVKQLEEKEAWQLFEKIAGEQAKNRILQRSAQKNEKIEGEQAIEGVEEIFQHCNRLPIDIATLASTLENKNLIQWRTTIKKLRSQMSSKLELEVNLNGMSPSLYSAIELRYGDLESKKLQQTLLLCGLMGHNAGIQDLLKYGIGLELFPAGANIEAARVEAVNLVGKLRKTFFLLDGGNNMHFDMHDLIQEVAILIASGDHDVLALRKDAAKKKLDQEELKKSKWIYLSNVDAARLPYRLKCPQLTFFHLDNKNTDFEISDKFFRGVDRLRVLGLTRMHFSSIPSSISLLVNLRTLRLDQSKLGTNLGSIMGALKNLQVLSLVGCDIKELPQETKELGKLTLLDLSDCSKLIVIPPDVLKSLSQLEELYLGNSFDQWGVVEKHDKIRNVSLDELTQLKNLTSLEVRIHDINMIPDDLFSIELKRYKICIGDVCNHWGSSFEHSKTLKLKHDGSISSDKVKMLPNKVEELHIEKLNAVKDVFNELHQKGFQELKCLHVKKIDLEIEHLFFNPKEEIHGEVLPKLEVLFLHGLKGLQKIFHGQFGKPSLEKLRIITVTGCNRLKNLFSFSVAKQLHSLRDIRVTDCSDIVEIVNDDEQEDANVISAEETDDVIELAVQIQCLRLQRLTKFISFSQDKIIGSRRLLLFNEKLVAEDRIWNLTKLIIESCDQLENLFFESIGDCLEKLEHLEIRKCKKMREIIVGEAGEGVSMFTFPSLKQLAIDNCPELKKFVEDDQAEKYIDCTALFHDNVRFFTLETMSISNLKNLNIIWWEFDSYCFYLLNFLHIKDLPNLIRLCQNREDRTFKGSKFRYLEQLIIENCLQLNGPLFDEEFVCPNLRIMTVSHLKNLKIIWKNPDKDSFCNLRSLRVTYCQNLSTIFPCNSGMFEKLLGSLKELEIIGCSSIKHVFELGQSDITGQAEQAEEHKLKVITIADCPNMVTFASTISRDQEQWISEPFFSAKFVFPNLERMTVSHLKSLNIIRKTLAENSFCNLRSLGVSYCQNLSTIFPCNSGMIKGLLGSLQELEIIGCSSVKEVFELEQSDVIRQAEEAEECKFIFQQLKVITIADCPDMVTFASTLSRDQKQETSTPFFSVKVEFPNLELLVMEDCHRFKYLMTLSTVQSFLQLKELVIRGCKRMEEVIVTEKFTEENRISLFPKLNSMELEDLPELTRFCSEPQNLQATALFVFPKVTNLKFSKLPKLASFLTKNATEWPELTSIHVRECDQVQIFALEFPSEDNQIEGRTQQYPLFWVNKGLEGQEGSSRSSTIDMPSVSFMNLRTLDLSRCNGLVTVLRYRMAKRLDQLSTMSITECSKLEEIVACEGNEVQDEIVFTQLRSLRLGLLSRLESFCSGKGNFSFPSLHEVILSKCPEMSTFSKGVVKTEKLQKVKLTVDDDAGIWKDGDLNSYIQYLFTNKNQPPAEPFKTKTLPHLDGFHGRYVQGANAIVEDKKRDNDQEKEQNEDDGLDHNENKGEKSVSLDDSHPSVAEDIQESASKRNEVALSSKEKKRDEDAAIVARDAQEPDSKRAEGEPIAECIVNAARLLGNDLIKEVNKELIKSIGSDVMLLEKSSKLVSALSKIEGLTEDERNIVLRKLPDHPIQMLIFFNLSPDRRLAWVRGFLMDH